MHSPIVGRARELHADVDLDGLPDLPDLFVFVNVWFAGAQGADFDASGTVTPTDLFAFFRRWFAAQ